VYQPISSVERSLEKELLEELRQVSLAMFRKNMVGIFHGSISARIELNKFIINTKEAIFDDLKEKDLILLYHNRDYRWKEASIDSAIHSQIYTLIPDAKFIAYTMPPYTTSYALKHDVIEPIDYFGKTLFPRIEVYDTKHFEDWYDRAEVEISRFMYEKNIDLMVVRGYGVYAHARDLTELVKMFAIVENSCRILLLSQMDHERDPILY